MKIKKIFAITLAVLILTALFSACNNKDTASGSSAFAQSSGTSSVGATSTLSVDESNLKDGTYSAEGAAYDASGYKSTATVTITDGVISSVKVDDVKEDGTSKRELSEDGQYNMKAAGNAKAEWHEEIALFETAVVNKGVSGIPVSSDGKTDAVSGCTISVNQYLDVIAKAIAKAK